jgi:hypothetical protein
MNVHPDLRVMADVAEHHHPEVVSLGSVGSRHGSSCLGFAPDDLGMTPWPVVVCVAKQSVLPPHAIKAYGHQIHTRTTHLQQARAGLDVRPALPLDFAAFTSWLVDRALGHDKPMGLLQFACDELHRELSVRPGVTRLERLVAAAREQAEPSQRLMPGLIPARQAWLDTLPESDPGFRAPTQQVAA